MTAPREPQTPDSDIPPADWRSHPEGFEDGFFEDWDGDDDNGGTIDGWNMASVHIAKIIRSAA